MAKGDSPLHSAEELKRYASYDLRGQSQAQGALENMARNVPNDGAAQKVDSFEKQRLLKLHARGGLMGVDARERLMKYHGMPKSYFEDRETNRLQGLASKNNRLGVLAKRQLQARGAAQAAAPAVTQVASNSMGTRMSELAGKTDSQLLMRIAAATEVTAKKKTQTLEPANLGM